MAFLLLSIALGAVTFALVRPALASDAGLTFASTDGRAVVVVFPLFLLITISLGLSFGIAMMMALILRELGQMLGYRLAGHGDALFRPIPLPGGEPMSRREPDHDLAEFFTLMTGAGLGLAPMLLAFAISDAFATGAPALAATARSYALAAGAVNVIALLPLWPLPGGQLLRLLVRARFPKLTGLATAAFAAFVLGLALSLHSPLMVAFGLLGALALAIQPTAPAPRPPLRPGEMWLGLAAYGVTLIAYAMAGWWVFTLALPG